MLAECLAVELAGGDQRRLTGSGSALEALRDEALYKSTYLIVTYLLFPSNTDVGSVIRYSGCVMHCSHELICSNYVQLINRLGP